LRASACEGIVVACWGVRSHPPNHREIGGYLKLTVYVSFRFIYLIFGFIYLFDCCLDKMSGWVTLSETPSGVKQRGSLSSPTERHLLADVEQTVANMAAIAAGPAANVAQQMIDAAGAVEELRKVKENVKANGLIDEAVRLAREHGPKVVQKVLEHLDVKRERFLSKVKERTPNKKHVEIAAQLGLQLPPSGGKNTALASLSNMPAYRSQMAGESVRRVHMPHEMIATVSNNTGPLPTTRRAEYHINPANHPLFPWLHSIAAKYGFWRFENLEFKFTSTTPKTATGSVAMCVYYDTEDHPPRTISEFMNVETGAVSYIGNDLTLKARPDLLMGGLQVKRCRGAATPYDMNLFDGGHFYIETWGGANTDEAGWLTVSYDVVFWMPTPYLGVGSVRPQNRSYLKSKASLVVPSGTCRDMTFSLLAAARDISVDQTGAYTGEAADVGILIPTGQFHVIMKVRVVEDTTSSWGLRYSVGPVATAKNGVVVEDVGGFSVHHFHGQDTVNYADTGTDSTFFVVMNVSDPDSTTLGYTNDERGFKIGCCNNSTLSYTFDVGLCLIPA